MFYKILWISIIGGILNLDSRVVGQMMLYRPFVAGTIVGLILGEIQTGILVGALVELMWIGGISMGVVIPWNTGAIGILSAGLVILSGKFSGEIVVLSMALAIPYGWLFKKVDVWWRYKNKLCNRWIEEWIEKDKLNKIVFLKWAVILTVFVSSFLFYFFALVITTPVIAAILKIMNSPFKKGLKFAYELLPFLGFAIAWNVFSSRHEKNKKPCI